MPTIDIPDNRNSVIIENAKEAVRNGSFIFKISDTSEYFVVKNNEYQSNIHELHYYFTFEGIRYVVFMKKAEDNNSCPALVHNNNSHLNLQGITQNKVKEIRELRIRGHINEETLNRIMPILENISDDSKVVLKIDSSGGNSEVYERISEKLLKLRDEQNCFLIGEGTRFNSAAFLLFIICNERRIIPESKGMIHLTEYNDPDSVKQPEQRKELEKIQLGRAQLISTYTAFTIDDVYFYNYKILNAAQLLKWKVADKIVSYFTY